MKYMVGSFVSQFRRCTLVRQRNHPSMTAGSILGGHVAAIPVGNVGVAEQHLNLFGPVHSDARQDFDPLPNLGEPQVDLYALASLSPGNPIEGGGNVQKLAANLEVNSVENVVSGKSRGHGGVPQEQTQLSAGGISQPFSLTVRTPEIKPVCRPRSSTCSDFTSSAKGL
jgi:hypothetical protein